MLIGEAGGFHEDAQGRPFVGPSGFKLQEWWRAVGLQRSDFYITNVYPYRPPANKIEAVPKAELAGWAEQLHDRLAALDDPVVLVPTGNTALKALTGKNKIMKHRGSIYGYEDRRGRTIKVIPTIHPAAIFRTPAWERRCRKDWARIADDAQFRDLRLPEREHFTRPTIGDVEDYVYDAIARADILSLDIETPGGEIVCIGFSFEPHFSITIPTTERYWGGPDQLAQAWAFIRTLCTLPCEKVMQNGLFDTFYLADHGIRVRNWRWDTLAMHHCLDATDEHGLAYMASVDTRQPYWKDDAKDPDEAAKYASNMDALWTYNGIDAAVQRELCDTYRGRLEGRGAIGFYDRHYGAMFAPLLSCMRRGVRLDERARGRQFARLAAECISIQDRLTELAGEPLYGKKDLSNKKVARFLYETLKLPKQIKRATGKATADEVTIRKLMLKHGRKPDSMSDEEAIARDTLAALGGTNTNAHRVYVAGNLILDHRRKKKLTEFLDDGKIDADGRLRCQYRFTTETGRLSSSKNPKGTGRNLQNVDRELRNVFLPDDGCVFLEADLSQAESRVVGMLSGDARMVEIARSLPWQFDVHTFNASIIFKVDEAAVTKSQRYLGKKAVHASNYGMRGTRLADELLKEGYVLTPDECQKMIDSYLDKHPAIRQWQSRVRAEVLANRCLVNSWGRMIEFEFDRMDDDLYRRAYAFVPQSEVADLLNQWGLIPVYKWLRANKMRSRLNLQIHDAVLISAVPDEVWDIMQFLKKTLERPRTINGQKLVIPVEFKLGRTWKGDVEFKRPPTVAEVEEAIGRLVGVRGEPAEVVPASAPSDAGTVRALQEAHT